MIHLSYEQREMWANAVQAFGSLPLPLRLLLVAIVVGFFVWLVRWNLKADRSTGEGVYRAPDKPDSAGRMD